MNRDWHEVGRVFILRALNVQGVVMGYDRLNPTRVCSSGESYYQYNCPVIWGIPPMVILTSCVIDITKDGRCEVEEPIFLERSL